MITRLSPVIAVVFRHRIVPITSDNLSRHRRRIHRLMLKLFPRIP